MMMTSHEAPPPSRLNSVLVAVLVTGFGLALAWAVLSLPRSAVGLSPQVGEKLTESGARNPVTAVLINFRGYDTLLEIAVLLLAGLGVWTLSITAPASQWRPSATPLPMLMALLRLVMPAMVLIAVYFLWVGADAAGGAFQGGAVLGAAGVLYLLTDLPLSLLWPGWILRLLMLLGLAVFLAVAAGAMGVGGHLLEYPRTYAGSLILLIEGASMISIGWILIVLFAGGPTTGDADTGPRTSPEHTP